jgi:hypothetical protein
MVMLNNNWVIWLFTKDTYFCDSRTCETPWFSLSSWVVGCTRMSTACGLALHTSPSWDCGLQRAHSSQAESCSQKEKPSCWHMAFVHSISVHIPMAIECKVQSQTHMMNSETSGQEILCLPWGQAEGTFADMSEGPHRAESSHCLTMKPKWTHFDSY